MIQLDKYVKKSYYDAITKEYVHLNKATLEHNIHVETGKIENYPKNISLYNSKDYSLQYPNYLVSKGLFNNITKLNNSNVFFLHRLAKEQDENDAIARQETLYDYQKNIVYTIRENHYLPQSLFYRDHDYQTSNKRYSIYEKNNKTNLVTTNLFHPDFFYTYEIYLTDFSSYHPYTRQIIPEDSIIWDFYKEGDANFKVNDVEIETNDDSKPLELHVKKMDIIETVYSDDKNAYMILFLNYYIPPTKSRKDF